MFLVTPALSYVLHHQNSPDAPDVWITNLEDLRVKMELQGSSMSDIHFMIHILNNLPKEYEVSQAKLEDRINDESNPLTIEEIGPS